MPKETVLVVGLGEIGRPLFELLKESGNFAVYGLDINRFKMHEAAQKQSDLPREVDTMHICIPCNNQKRFVDIVAGYAQQFEPKLLVINSTVPPGTTMKVHDRCKHLTAHSPVRGVHKNMEHMKSDLNMWTKYVGGADSESGEAATKHFEKLGLRTKTLKSCLETELAKLFETTYRAWMIVCFQEMHRISRHYHADFDEIVDFIEDTHRLRFDRPVMYPNVIGKHCLIPNIELLLEGYDSEFLRLILKSNEKRREEIKDKNVLAEAQKIEKRAEALQSELRRRP